MFKTEDMAKTVYARVKIGTQTYAKAQLYCLKEKAAGRKITFNEILNKALEAHIDSHLDILSVALTKEESDKLKKD